MFINIRLVDIVHGSTKCWPFLRWWDKFILVNAKYVYCLMYHTYVHVICNLTVVHQSIFFIVITKFPNKKAVLYDFFFALNPHHPRLNRLHRNLGVIDLDFHNVA